ncbi:MAG: helix-turn-helix transcriptional regulator [Clostridium sp.]
MTQKELASATGISLKTIANIESKQHIPSLLYAMRIADFFSQTGNKPVLLSSWCSADSL